MGSRLKEEERNERTIRGLLKFPENRRCINCGSMGPQYVCTNFCTFVCTNCSGVHREFTHRIKSISMAKFTAAEVDALKNGGNERARQQFLKEWDLQRNSLPDSSNTEKLRDFIKTVYVDRRFTGDRLPPKGRPSDRDEKYDSRRPDYRGSKSPPFDDQYDDRRSNGRRRSDVDRGRPPFEDRRYEDRNDDRRAVRFDEKRSPGRFETERGRYEERRYEERSRFDDRDRQSEDRFANEVRDRRRYDDRTPSTYRDYDGGSSPQVRPVRDILGDNVPPLRVDDLSQTNGRVEEEPRSLTSPAEQRKDIRIPKLTPTGSFGNGSSLSSPASLQRAASDSLIDFSAETPTAAAAPVPAAAAELFGVGSTTPVPQAVSNDTGWATFDVAFAAPAPAPAATGVAPGLAGLFPGGDGGGQWNGGWVPQPVPELAPGTEAWSAFPAPHPPSATGPQAWNSYSAPKVQAPQVAPDQATSSLSQQTYAQERPRRELPQDIFTSPFQPTVVQNVGMPMQNAAFLTGGAQFQPMGPAMPGPMGPMPAYAQPPRSRNPFDLPGDPPPPSAFPSMGPLQAALPNYATGPQSLPGAGPGSVTGPGNFPSPWAQPNNFQPQHASYPPGGSLGINLQGSTIPNDRIGNPGSFPLGPFGQDNSFFSHRPSPLTTQHSLPPLGGQSSFPTLTSQNALPSLSPQGSVSSFGSNPFG